MEAKEGVSVCKEHQPAFLKRKELGDGHLPRGEQDRGV